MEGAPKPKPKRPKGQVLYDFSRFKTGLIAFLFFCIAVALGFRGVYLLAGHDPNSEITHQDRVFNGPCFIAGAVIMLLAATWLVNSLSRPLRPLDED
jgi:hypothetical protein